MAGQEKKNNNNNHLGLRGLGTFGKKHTEYWFQMIFIFILSETGTN